MSFFKIVSLIFLIFSNSFSFAGQMRNDAVESSLSSIDRDQSELIQVISEERNRLEEMEAEKVRQEESDRLLQAKRDQKREEAMERQMEAAAGQQEEIRRRELDRLREEQQMMRQQRMAEAEQKSRRLTAHIDLSQQRMMVYRGDMLLYKWRISTARRGYVTPVGTYRPQVLERMHYSKRYHNSPMPHSIFFRGNFAIHGTNHISRLGRRASHGCVRLHPKNARKLYALVQKHGKKNTTIKITY